MYISISQEMVRFKKIHDSYCGIFANMSVFIYSVPRGFLQLVSQISKAQS